MPILQYRGFGFSVDVRCPALMAQVIANSFRGLTLSTLGLLRVPLISAAVPRSNGKQQHPSPCARTCSCIMKKNHHFTQVRVLHPRWATGSTRSIPINDLACCQRCHAEAAADSPTSPSTCESLAARSEAPCSVLLWQQSAGDQLPGKLGTSLSGATWNLGVLFVFQLWAGAGNALGMPLRTKLSVFFKIFAWKGLLNDWLLKVQNIAAS